MRRSNTDPSIDPTTPSRRTLLKLGAGAATAAVGLGALSGSVAAWDRLEVDFRSETEVWLLVGDDLDYDPPAAVHVLVEMDDEVDCRLLEVTRTNATYVEEYGDIDVVPFEAEGGARVLGVLPYNRSPDADSRFERPRCVMPNDHVDTGSTGATARDAECVRSAATAHWDGVVKQCWWDPVDPGRFGLSQRTKLSPADGGPDADFGAAVATDAAGSTVLVGSPGEAYPHGEDGGAAYVFTNHGGEFVQTAKLAAEDGESHDRFGLDVALDAAGETALVGQRSSDADGSEAAYVFERDGESWAQTHKLTPPDDRENLDVGGFGTAVDLDGGGDRALVGAPATADLAHSAGIAFVAERTETGWSEPTVLRHASGDGNYLGTDVALDTAGTTGFAGAPTPQRTTDAIRGGYVSVFREAEETWSPTTRLRADDGEPTDGLGTAVDCSGAGQLLVAGRPGEDVGVQDDRGGAVVFRQTATGWTQVTRIPGPGGAQDGFGEAVTVDRGGRATLVGAPGHDNLGGEDAGAAFLYVYDGGGWSGRGRLQAEDAADGDGFGASVALDDDVRRAVVGAPGVGAVETGAVYVFD